ncbi:TonB-dependent receptor [Novosphingobium sp. Gsoil 351]|uniref:TonB-dependent receptor n=1 Tax=Novosphingobium sp. Gsoil 351 TaxID=2675225 RepID=UPI0018A7FAE8|nr:TonB-dependent receptor [Novosphingobium sp. Gsoil 351]
MKSIDASKGSRRSIDFTTAIRVWLLSCATFVVAPAHAQTVAEPEVSAMGADDTEAQGEIIVTARKQSEALSKVGLPITAATGDELVARGITTVTELVKLEPSLQYAKSFDSTPIFTIRGVGYNDNSIQAPPTVSVYQDEVPYAYSVMTKGAMLDVQRVEILKGPQGTLFGQNATGGAINFIANKPGEEFGAGVTATYGRFNAVHFDGYVSGPLAPSLKARIALATDLGGAWQRSNTRDDRLGDKNMQQARVLLEWEPSANFSALLNLNGWRDRSETQAQQLFGFFVKSPQFVGLGAGKNQPTPAQVAAMPAYAAELRQILQQPLSPRRNRAADWVAGTHPELDQRFRQAALRLNWEVNEGLGFTSLTSFEHYTQADEIDNAGVALLANNRLSTGEVDSFFQEIRAHGGLGEGFVKWQLGGSYVHDKSNQIVDQYTTQSGSYFSGFPPSVGGNPPFHRLISYANNTTETKSIFGSVSVALLDDLKLNGSARYTDVKSDFGGCVGTTDRQLELLITNVFGDGKANSGQCITVLSKGGPSGYFRTTLNEDNIAWRLGLEWQATANTLIYGLVSRGYKAAASPILTATTAAQLRPVTQESVIDYEAGIKTRLFGNTLQFNGSVFYYDYRNKQLLARFIDPIFGALQGLVNIPKSREFGAEASVVWKPIADLTLDGAVTYLNSRVESDFPNTDVYGNAVNFKGEHFPFTPKWSASGGVRVDLPVGDHHSGYLGARGSYQSATVTSFGESAVIAARAPSIAIKSYGLLDLSAGIAPNGGNWKVEFWARNVTNTYYWVNFNSGGDVTVRLTGMPRTYGATVQLDF